MKEFICIKSKKPPFDYCKVGKKYRAIKSKDKYLFTGIHNGVLYGDLIPKEELSEYFITEAEHRNKQINDILK